MTTAVSFQNISRYFGPVRAVDDVTLDIAEGEFFAMLGPSGSGKTTCLRLIAGFEQPTSGHMEIFGVTSEGVPPYQRNVNTVFQDYALFPHMTVLDNVAYGLMVKGIDKPTRHLKAQEALTLVALGSFGSRRPSQLSGGQRQRVALARALVNEPKVLLLDEPLGALDLKLREQMQVELKALQRNLGITFVFVTHDQEEALTLSDRIAVMSKGRVLQIDAPEALYENPNCREVAEFIGTMNVFPGRIAGVSKGQTTLDARALGALQVAGENPKGKDVFLAVRPEKLKLMPKKPAASLNSIAGVVSAISYRGDRHHFLVTVKGHDRPISVSQQNDGDAKSTPMNVGTKVWITWPASTGRVLSH